MPNTHRYEDDSRITLKQLKSLLEKLYLVPTNESCTDYLFPPTLGAADFTFFWAFWPAFALASLGAAFLAPVEGCN